MKTIPESVTNPIINRLVTKATSATPAQLQAFSPQKIHYEISTLLSSGFVPLHIHDLAGALGRHINTVQRALKPPAAVAWILSESARKARLGLAGAHMRLMREALTNKSPRWMDMYLRRFDPDYSDKSPSGGTTTNNNLTIFASWTEEEIQAFLRDKRQKVLGEVPPNDS